ncbi:MAG: hypothetical protein R2991_06980 [Thermoanaerobaculia bacterium]
MIRVVLPVHPRTLARVEGEVEPDVDGEPTVAAVLTALETRYPVLTGAIRDRSTGEAARWCAIRRLWP